MRHEFTTVFEEIYSGTKMDFGGKMILGNTRADSPIWVVKAIEFI